MIPARSLTVLGALALCVGAAVAQPETTREIHKVFPLAKDGRVLIDTYKGSVEVRTWDKAEVEVHVLIESDGGGRRDEENVALTDINFRASSGEVRMETDYDRMKSRRSFLGISWNNGNLPLVHYTVTMPSSAELEIEDYKSESTISSLMGDLRFETYKGTLEADGLGGSIKLETYKGEIDIALTQRSGDCRMETYKGTIRLKIPKGSGFDLDAEIGRRGDLSSDFDIADTRRWHDDDEREYRGPVNGGGPEIHLETYKGSYRLEAW
jgi:hypothetical protein